MSRLSLLTFAALAALSACTAAAEADLHAADTIAAPVIAAEAAPEYVAPAYVAPERVQRVNATDGVTCEVRSRRTANGVLIQARAFADRDFSGEYDFVITKSGGGGSADISQGGAVDLEAGNAATLGENEISVERGARVRAVLTLSDASGQLCRRTFNL